MSKKCMISQPMNGLTDEQIRSTRDRAIIAINEAGYEVLNSYFPEYSIVRADFTGVNIPVYYLANAIEVMSECEAVYFCKGWDESRGCKIEHEIAKQYGYICIYEE